MVTLFAETSTSKRLKIASQSWVIKLCKHCEYWLIWSVFEKNLDNDAKQPETNCIFCYIWLRFYLQHFFHNFEFLEEIAKSKFIIFTSYFNTLIFKFSRFKMDFRIFFENFYADRWYQLSEKHQRHLLMK